MIGLNKLNKCVCTRI